MGMDDKEELDDELVKSLERLVEEETRKNLHSL